MLAESQKEVLACVCAGNKEAFVFCETLVGWLHWIDDMADRDRTWQPSDTVRINLAALATFAANPFFQKHRTALMSLLTQAFCGWLDGEQWAKRANVRERRAADVIKSTYHEVIWHVAYLVGGWNHLRHVTATCRAYDFDCEE
jgi:hypothetical protein